jgi:hypothetical protein
MLKESPGVPAAGVIQHAFEGTRVVHTVFRLIKHRILSADRKAGVSEGGNFPRQLRKGRDHD